MELIRKYKSRKMYSSQARSYLGIDDITKRIVTGNEFKVIDNSTKQDVTIDVVKACFQRNVEVSLGTMIAMIRVQNEQS